MKKSLFLCALVFSAGGLRAAVTRDTVVSGLALSTSSFMQTSVAMDSRNNIHMSFYDPATESLKYAKLNNGSAVWTVSNITAAGVRVAPQNDLALDNFTPHVVYYRIDDTLGGVYRARWTGSAWQSDLVDETFVGTNTFVSIAVGNDGNPRVVYAHSPSSAAVYAEFDAVWSTTTIFISSAAMGMVDLALGPTDTPFVVFTASTSEFGWGIGVASRAATYFGGFFYYGLIGGSVPARALALDVDSGNNFHVVWHDPSVVGSSFTYAVFDPEAYLRSDTPFDNPAYLIDTTSGPVFADIAVDSNDNAVILVSTGPQLNLYKYTGTDTPTRTVWESTSAITGVGPRLALNRFDSAVVSCYTDDGGGEVRFLTEAIRGLSISGTVRDFSFAALPGTDVSLTGWVDTVSDASDAAGAFGFGTLFEGNYTLTPSKAGYGFQPGSISLTRMRANASGQDFMGGEMGFAYVGNLIDPTKGDEVTFNYSVLPGPVAFNIYNLRGTHIKTLMDQNLTAGTYINTWDGRDSGGDVVASGIYLFRFKSDQFEKKGKVAVVK